MGLMDFFKGRRRNEDALASARAGGDVAPAPPPAPVTGEHGESIGAPVNPMQGFAVPGMEHMGALGPMIQQAIDAGHAQVYQPTPQVMNMGEHADEARTEILEVLAKHGINAQPGSGQSIPVYDANMMNEIFGVLGKHGMNPGGMGGQPPAAEPPSSS
jgi:hypothetical protein